MPKPAGISFNRYAAIAGRVLRQALKDDKRVAAQRQDSFELKVAKWKNGVQEEPKIIDVPLSKN